MSGGLTPEQAIRRALADSRGTANLNRENYLQDAVDAQLAALAEHGYVIADLDDVPRMVNGAGEDGSTQYCIGWNGALDAIIAAEQEPTP